MSWSELQPGGLPHSSDGTLNWAADTDPVGPYQSRREEDMSTAEFGDPNLGTAPAPAPATDGQFSPLTLSPAAPLEPLVQPVPAPPVPAPPAPIPVTDMRDVPLGTLIFREGLLTEEQLEEALQDGMQRGKRLGEVLLERGLVSENDLGRLLAGQKGLPFVQLDAAVVDPAAVGLLSVEKARLHTVLPIGFQHGLPVVAVADPTNDLVIENVRRGLNCEPHFVVAGRDALQRQIEVAYGATAAPAPPVEPVVDPLAAPAPLAVAPVETVPAPAPEPSAVAPTQPPLALEQPVAQPILQPEPMTQPVVSTEPSVVEQPPALPQEPPPAPPPISFAPEQPVVQPPAFDPTPLVPEPVMPVEPVMPAEPVVAEPPVAFEPVMETPAQPVQVPEPETTFEEELVQTCSVVLRLADGERIEVAAFQSNIEAKDHARAVVEEITSGSGWPFFDGRFLRPERIVSVDVVEPEGRWLGSAARRAAWQAEQEL